MIEDTEGIGLDKVNVHSPRFGLELPFPFGDSRDGMNPWCPRLPVLDVAQKRDHYVGRRQDRDVNDGARHHRISSILCTAPSGRVSPKPMLTMRFKNAYASAEV